MKRKIVPITLLITALMVIFGIWAYNAYIRPIYLNNKSQTKEVRMQESVEVAFGKSEFQGAVYGLELELSGESHSNFDVYISTRDNIIHAAGVKGKHVDFVYKNEWHSDSVFLELVPKDLIGGTVTIECRFLALEPGE